MSAADASSELFQHYFSDTERAEKNHELQWASEIILK